MAKKPLALQIWLRQLSYAQKSMNCSHDADAIQLNVLPGFESIFATMFSERNEASDSQAMKIRVI